MSKQRSLASWLPLSLSVASVPTNSENWISSSLFLSKMLSRRPSSGFWLSSGIASNSSVVSVPLPSRSSFLNRRYSRRSSYSVTVARSAHTCMQVDVRL